MVVCKHQLEMDKRTLKSQKIGPGSERTFKVQIYPEEGNTLSSRKKKCPWMWKRGTVKKKGEGPVPGMDAAETTWVSGSDFDFSVS